MDTVESVCDDLRSRRTLGMERYGKPVRPFDGEDYLQHLYEELMDGLIYLKVLRSERKTGGAADAH